MKIIDQKITNTKKITSSLISDIEVILFRNNSVCEIYFEEYLKYKVLLKTFKDELLKPPYKRLSPTDCLLNIEVPEKAIEKDISEEPEELCF